MKYVVTAMVAAAFARRYSALPRLILFLAAVLALSHRSFADEPRYRVLLPRIAGAHEVETGNIDAGIELLESQLTKKTLVDETDVWTALCAAYIYKISLIHAEHACDKAVEIDRSHLAFNNRGVFRVYKSDLIGAEQDFIIAKSQKKTSFSNQTATISIRQVASDNAELLAELLEMRAPRNARASTDLGTARIEDLNN